MKDNKSGWQFPKALEIIKCKEGNKEFMKERPARRPFGNTVLICEYPIDDTSIKNISDFVRDFHALVGVHQHPVDQQLGQFGGQCVRIKNRLGRFLSAVLPCLFVLLLLRLCQYCGIGVFCFQQQLVTRSLFCFVGVQVDLTHEIAFIQGALTVLQCLDLLLIFGAFRYGSIYPERTVRGKRCGGFHLDRKSVV